METPPPSDHDLDLALRRYNIVLVHLVVVRQMTWTKTQFFLALNIGLLILAGALAKNPFIGISWPRMPRESLPLQERRQAYSGALLCTRMPKK
jgi:hypothetical protein